MTTVRNIAQGVRSFTSNVFLVEGERTVLVDAGNDFDAVERIEGAVDDLDALVLTHTHPDHIGNARSVIERFDVDVWGYDADASLVDYELADGDTLAIGDAEYEALYTPGHKNDHLCFYSRDAGTLFAGDLIFANGGFGRTDLEEGDRSKLIESIEYVYETVDDDLAGMYVGHGPAVESHPKNHVELALQAAKTGF
ncbi:MAG: hydroxyacylglutathione hydrolase [Natronomonas sp.]|jgi:hydroxyacylglutathione hydrolase|uniref:MBL fold metallo-hydrolase n=1 Tax=Natronomonas sp. TaxID=2184060 RepID=UPI003989327F